MMGQEKEDKIMKKSAQECLSLAKEFLNQEKAWAPHVQFNENERYFHLLHEDEDTEVWLLCWTGANDTGWHDHGASQAGVVVASGDIMEDIPTLSGAVARKMKKGDEITMENGHIHRMYAQNTQGVSIHVYSPPLSRVSQYYSDDTGRLYRIEQDGSKPLG